MEKLVFAAAFTLISIASLAEPIEPLKKKTIEEMTPAERAARVEKLDERLEEIKSFPIDELNKEERKALRKEVKQIKKETKALDSVGIYISGTALLALLLILLLI